MAKVRWNPTAKAAYRDLPFLARMSCSRTISKLAADPTNFGRGLTAKDARRTVTFAGGRGMVVYIDSRAKIITIEAIIY